MRTSHTIIDSPLGELTLVARDGILAGLYFQQHSRRPGAAAFGHRGGAEFAAAIQQLAEYFRGERMEFELPLAPPGNAFQHRVWGLLRRIPYGETRSYGQLAAELGDRTLAREVGAANGRNPLSVIVPCHRVVGADGSLVGYAGGLPRKRFLLELEGAAPVRQLQLEGLA
ncbi:MAG TPA: methylated-DNA--[protein]-cysteine S-methyltransferase [Gemmatimonadaceae bacterium]|nr:methylated-DNA--[protein]-cysteine S-methyltransferase [Gemmatimonadaceae bacterium]